MAYKMFFLGCNFTYGKTVTTIQNTK